AITSNAGWDTVVHQKYLKELISHLKKYTGRVSVFVDPQIEMVAAAAEAGADRIELYTEPYASNYHENKLNAIAPYIEAAKEALQHGLAVNAGHDLDLHNLRYLKQQLP